MQTYGGLGWVRYVLRETIFDDDDSKLIRSPEETCGRRQPIYALSENHIILCVSVGYTYVKVV